MPRYSYEAVNFAGELIAGEMEAAGTQAVVEHLRQMGYLPIKAEQKIESLYKRIKELKFFGKERLSTRDLTFLTRELTTMLQAGLSLERSLTMLASLAEKPEIAAFLEGVVVKMRAGSNFADALAAQEDSLPRAYVGMVRAGEAGGGKMLESALDRLTDYLQKAQNLRETISSAMLYPIILLVMAVLSIVLILLYVLPQFEPLFESAGAALPLSTQIVVGAGHFLRDYGIALLGLLVLGVFAARRALQREDVRMKVDAFLLRVPKIGPIIVKVETGKFCRTLGSLQAHGIPLAAALLIASESFSNRNFVSMAERLERRVREGEAFSAQLSREEMFPPLAMQMVRIGEETGRLDAMLLKIADIHDHDVHRSVEKLMGMLAPAMTVILGVVIAAIIGAVLSAILGVNDLVG